MSESAVGDNMRVMTFNILTHRAWGRQWRWSRRKKAVLAAIGAFGPDLLGVQEANSLQAKYIGKHADGLGMVAAGRSDGLHRGEHVPVYFRKERFQKLDEGHFWYSKTPDRPGSRYWYSLVPRMATWVHLQDRRAGRELHVFNTHLCCFWEGARTKSARLLHNRVRGRTAGGAAVLMGDYNAPAGGLVFGTLAHAEEGPRLIDAYRQVHPHYSPKEGTLHGPMGVQLPARIDWILHTDHLRAVAADIDRQKRLGRHPSDHYPVTAELQWDGEA
jgi:endonuclease/exonuclease/phosphatase family metal-dependent hydrolase